MPFYYCFKANYRHCSHQYCMRKGKAEAWLEYGNTLEEMPDLSKGTQYWFGLICQLKALKFLNSTTGQRQAKPTQHLYMVQADLQQYRVLPHLNKITSSPLRCSHFPSPTSDSTVHKPKQRIFSWQFQQITHCTCSNPIMQSQGTFLFPLHSARICMASHIQMSSTSPAPIYQNNNKKPHACFKSVLYSNFTELAASGFTNFCQPRYLTAVAGHSAPKQLINRGKTARGQWMSLLPSYCHSHCRHT